jgi:hypothetical protein
VMALAPAVLIFAVFANFALRPLFASRCVAIAQQREFLGDLQGAEISLRDGMRIWPNATGHFDLVRVLGKQERYAEALKQSQWTEHWVTEPELFLLRVRILRAMERETEAKQLLQESAQRFPYSRELADEFAGFSQASGGGVGPR